MFVERDASVQDVAPTANAPERSPLVEERTLYPDSPSESVHVQVIDDVPRPYPEAAPGAEGGTERVAVEMEFS